ncbi:uncharacterized protein [Anabrus simplex]|uniref:uncharacterized protein n=1 Tax=Anabrus simplex TaxID=316456 RepID=UPI0035A305AE
MNSNSGTPNRPVVTQEWSLHAELTFSHQRPTSFHQGSTSNPTTRQSDPNNRMHMQYLWNTQPEQSSSRRTLHPCYGFQRGNILFTTTPPSHSSQNNQTRNLQINQPVCGPRQSFANQTPPSHTHSQAASVPSYDSVANRTSQPYNRRCKSTCSIILSGDHASTSQIKSDSVGSNKNVDRGRSCSPVTQCYHTLTHRCGDPVCYHATPATPDDTLLSGPGFPSAIPESCEVCGGGRSPTAVRRAAKANTFTTHFCTRVPERVSAASAGEKRDFIPVKERKDAASQTSDVTSVGNTVQQTVQPSELENKIKKISAPVHETFVKKKLGKRTSSSCIKSKDHSSHQQGTDPTADCGTFYPEVEGSPHKPRTVHIDVYCTGSEDADADTSDLLDTETDSVEEGESWSSPQTVFESDKLRVVHKRASKNELPQALQQEQVSRKKSDLSRISDSFNYSSPFSVEPKGFDSDDGLTSQYPSKESSYTTLEDAESSLQSEIPGASRDTSWSTLSSHVYGDGYDSATATSWKDTATELDSLVQSSLSLAQSDSFDYADAIDRLRIREKERAWAEVEHNNSGDQSKSWQCPQRERKRILQRQKFREYVAKHLGKTAFPLWKPGSCEDSDDDEEDETGDTWSFGGGPSSPKLGTMRKEDNIKGSVKGEVLSSDKSTPTVAAERRLENASVKSFKSNTPHLPGDSGSLSDSGPIHCHKFHHRSIIGPFGSKSPSPPPAKLESTVTLPFTTIFGRRTDQLLKAQKFGTIVGAFRKPGHHVGPSKNPDCTCVHCREYYQGSAHRGRARSVGEMPLGRQIGKINS